MNVLRMLNDRGVERIWSVADDWQEQAAAHALAGNPRRADYLEWMAVRLHRDAPRLVAAAAQRMA